MKLTYRNPKNSLLILFSDLYNKLTGLVASIGAELGEINRNYGRDREDYRNLRVWRTMDKDGHLFWNAHDLRSDKKIRGVSEEQILAWIETRYYG